MWRSLVAHSSGGRGVASSNLVIPTDTKSKKTPKACKSNDLQAFFFFIRSTKNYEKSKHICQYEISVKQRIYVGNWNSGKGIEKGKNPDIRKLKSYL